MTNDLLREQALQGLQNGIISQYEYDALIESLGTLPINQYELVNKNIVEQNKKQNSDSKSNEQTQKIHLKDFINTRKQTIVISVVFLIAILSIIISIVTINNGLSGFATFDVPLQNYTGNMSIHATQEFTSMRISGTLFGDGTANVYYKTNNGTLLIGTITSNDGTPHTTKPSYAVGEEVTIQNSPISYNSYLDDGVTNTQTPIPFTAPATDMTLLIVANDTGNLTTYRLPILIGSRDRTTTFSNLCVDTCTMPASAGDIIIETTGPTQLTFTNIETTLKENTAPMLITPFEAIAINQTTTVNLAEHFVDTDGDTIYYSTENTNLATLTIENNTLTLTPMQDGNQTITIYASDLKEIATGTIELSVVGVTPLETNITINETTNTTTQTNITLEINTTTNETTNNTINTTKINNSLNETNTTIDANTTLNTNAQTNTTINTIQNTTLDCSNQNPNERPIECLLNGTTNYFLEQDIFWFDNNREPIARFSTVGNLLLTGDVVQHTNASSNNNRFSIGYATDTLGVVPTIWIDAAGNLQLRGALHEEQGQIVPPPGTGSFNNKKGITLAYANLQTGDLYLRGNVIPYRKSVIS